MSGPGIVVGVDGSAESMRAVEWAAREAIAHNLPVHVVSVPEVWPYHEPPGKMPDIGVAGVTVRAEREAAEQAVTDAAKRAAELLPDLPVTSSVPDGPAARQLLACAADATMLVVGSRGSGGFSGLTVGSLSRYLATHAPVPVVVVREETLAARRELVLGVRNPRQASAAASFAFAEAAVRGARLLVIEALPPRRLALFADANGDVLAATRDALEAQVPQWHRRHPGVEVAIDVMLAHPARILAAASARAELVVLGRRGSHSGPVGGIIHDVLAHAHGPVAVVPGELS
jgi:nucleotide-binding universal stress UspA family protein